MVKIYFHRSFAISNFFHRVYLPPKKGAEKIFFQLLFDVIILPQKRLKIKTLKHFGIVIYSHFR